VKFFRYRKPSVKTVLGVTKAKKKIKKQNVRSVIIQLLARWREKRKGRRFWDGKAHTRRFYSEV